MIERNEQIEYPQGKQDGETHEAVINQLNRGDAIEAEKKGIDKYGEQNQQGMSETIELQE